MKKPKRERKHVVFVLPTYTGTIHTGTCATVYGEGISLQGKGHRFSVMDDVGSADIAWSRALAVAKFLESEGTHLMWVDADVSGPPGCVQRLLNYDVDFVASAYPKRVEPIHFPLKYLPGKKGPVVDEESGLLEVAGVTGGFVCVSRSMLLKMCKAYGNLEYVCEAAPVGVAPGFFDNYFFTDEKGRRRRLGEDYSFCYRWREIGGKVLLDPEITLGHTGYKRFTGRLMDYLKAA